MLKSLAQVLGGYQRLLDGDGAAESLVCGLVIIAGALLCGIGLFVAMPVVKAATVYAYEDIFGARTPGNLPATGS